MKWRETSNRTCRRPFSSLYFFSFQLFLMSWKRKVGLLRPLRPRSEMEFVFSFFDERWVMGRHSGHTLREERENKDKSNSNSTNHSTFFSSSTKSNFFDLCWMKRRLVEWRQTQPPQLCCPLRHLIDEFNESINEQIKFILIWFVSWLMSWME